MLQGQKSQTAMELPEVPSELQIKSGNLPIYDITRFSTNASVAECKMVGHVKKRSISVRGNESKSIKCYSYGLPMLTLW
jgi:hypothetical protein